MTDKTLPAAFAELQPFVDEWALTCERDRYHKLHSVTIAQLRPFYEAMMQRLEGVLDYLNGYEIGAMPPDVQTLFDLTLTFAETAHPMDLAWKHVDFPMAYEWEKFEFRSVSTRRPGQAA